MHEEYIYIYEGMIFYILTDSSHSLALSLNISNSRAFYPFDKCFIIPDFRIENSINLIAEKLIFKSFIVVRNNDVLRGARV